ncbi:MAG TPA: hypothetical protein VM487_09695, partial [Phycisphaerae bacterium]|nr:hypothetical protein [Phycisphaerae bacterium]
MTAIRQPLRGLNTDLYPTRLPSGTADVALNCTVTDGLAKRDGFALWEDDVLGTGASVAVLSMTVARFADGHVYVVCKCADGKLYQRCVYSGDAGVFTLITGGQTHDTSDPGWFFLWRDRLHHFDRVGGTRWNPDVNSGVAYKAGLGKPTTGMTYAAAAGGEKDGRYHVCYSLYNSTTGEESAVSTFQTPALE